MLLITFNQPLKHNTEMRLIAKFTFVLFVTSFSNFNSFSQGKITISGSFWDDNTGVDLKSAVYGYSAGKKVKMAETDKNQRFNFDLETFYDSLSFESEGFSSVNIPIHFEGSFTKLSTANLSINSKGGSGQKQDKNLFVFCKPSTHQKGMKYGLYSIRKDSLFQNVDFSILMESSHGFAYPIILKKLNTNYKVISQSNDNEIVLDKTLKPKDGFTFIDLNIYQKEDLPISSEKVAEIQKEEHSEIIESIKTTDSNLPYNTFGYRTLFFDQSKYELKSENRMVLDSLAIYLMHKTDAKVKIAGFTDNIGNENLNTILAKYRAQVVGNYLKTKGVEPSKIQLKWIDQNNGSKQNQNDLSKYRKVVVSEME